MIDTRPQAISGVSPPLVSEVRIRETWPSVARARGIASLGRMLTQSIILAPLGWLLMSVPYFTRVMPFTACRYTLTNRRVMIRRGWSAKVSSEVPLDKIRDIRAKTDDNTEFFRAATLEIFGDGSQEPLLVLPAVSEFENFRRAILAARDAWYNRGDGEFIPASATN